MNAKKKMILLISLPLAGLVAGYLLMGRTVQARVDGETLTIQTRALTVEGALRSAGIELTAGDAVQPGGNTWLSKVEEIKVNHSRLVRVRVEPGGNILEVETALLTPQEILTTAGLNAATTDLVLLNGEPVALDAPLERWGEVFLEYRPAVKVKITMDGVERDLLTTANDLGTALWEAGFTVREGDRLSQPLDLPLTGDMAVELRSGREITVNLDGATVHGYSAAETVGEALAESGVALQDLDFSVPAEQEAVPEDGVIRVVRVTEELVMEQSSIPYEVQSLPDDTLEINTSKVVSAGAVGIKASRVRVRFEDGVEVGRENEGEVIIAEAVDRVVHYGTQIVDKYLDTPDGPITYYMALDVVATSYSPCRSGVPGKCYTGTSYGLPVKKGVIGVTRAWYYMFRGTQIYVPGYGVGTIADIGYYPYSDRWIDLGYSDDDYQSWGATNLTIYFLSPAPAGFTGVLP